VSDSQPVEQAGLHKELGLRNSADLHWSSR